MSVNKSDGYPDLSALEKGNYVETNSSPRWADSYEPSLVHNHQYGILSGSDDDNIVIIHNESTLCWALILMFIGFLFWPCFIVSFVLIRPVKRDLSSFSSQYCRVMTIYGVDVAGMVLGTIATIIAVIEIMYVYAK